MQAVQAAVPTRGDNQSRCTSLQHDTDHYIKEKNHKEEEVTGEVDGRPREARKNKVMHENIRCACDCASKLWRAETLRHHASLLTLT